jgi:hypothetical protein
MHALKCTSHAFMPPCLHATRGHNRDETFMQGASFTLR